MEYRKMENLGVETSLLGFGCMRFPKLANGQIDEEQAEKMIDMAMQAGVNYYDTAYPYHDGASEAFVGKVLKKYKREDFYLATKLPMWAIRSMDDVKRIFKEQLERLQMDYVDFYLLHALKRDRWELAHKLDLLSWCEEMRSQGKMRYIGFSFHDEYDVFEEIAVSRKWDFCQIQYNYMDTKEQAGKKGYDLAERQGIPLVLMEPVKGGMLAVLSEDVAAPLKEALPASSMASWALRWAGSQSNVKVVLSGMSSMEQLKDNLKTFQQFKELSKDEFALIEKVAESLVNRVKNSCTTCRYCMPCPFGIDIPRNFKVWNTYGMYGSQEEVDRVYFNEMPDKSRASQCQKCGKCETACPQGVLIREDLERMAGEFAGLKLGTV